MKQLPQICCDAHLAFGGNGAVVSQHRQHLLHRLRQGDAAQGVHGALLVTKCRSVSICRPGGSSPAAHTRFHINSNTQPKRKRSSPGWRWGPRRPGRRRCWQGRCRWCRCSLCAPEGVRPLIGCSWRRQDCQDRACMLLQRAQDMRGGGLSVRVPTVDVEDGAHGVGDLVAGVRLAGNVHVVAEGDRVASANGGPSLRRQHAAEH